MTETIIKMWNEGTSLETIARRLNMTVDTASQLLVLAIVWGDK